MIKFSKKEAKTLAGQSFKLLNRSLGVLFTYVVLFKIISDGLVYPLFNFLLNEALVSVPGNYISNSNIAQMFYHPQVILVLILKLAAFFYLSLLKASSILLVLESYYQQKPVRFFMILPCAAKQISHCRHPRNYLIFIYTSLFLPLIDASYSASLSSQLVIPEFIMDVVDAKTVLALLHLVLILVAVYFYLRYMFVNHYFILRRQSFREAAISSINLNKHKLILYIRTSLVGIVSMIYYYIFPYVLFVLGDSILSLIMEDYTYFDAINNYMISICGTPLIILVTTSCAQLWMVSYLITIFHNEEEKEGKAYPIELPPELLKEKGKIRSLKFFFNFTVIAAALAIYGLTAAMTLVCQEDPTYFNEMIAPTKIIAHKGYSSKAPENTMSAFELAANDDKVDYIEMDIRETKDGVPVVIHNASLSDATAGACKKDIYDVTYDELQTLNACYGFDTGFEDEKVPTLEEVLEKYAATEHLIIEIKMSDKTPDLPAKIVALMEKYNCTDTSMIHSGTYDALTAVKEINPDIQCGYIVAVGTGGYMNLPDADFVSVEHNLATNIMVLEAHMLGKEVYVWTVNNVDTMQEMAQSTVDGVITDYPDDADDYINSGRLTLIDALSNTKNTLFRQPDDDDAAYDDY